VRILGLFFAGALVAMGVGIAYRTFIAPWEGDARGTLISATMSGIAFFVVCVVFNKGPDVYEPRL